MELDIAAASGTGAPPDLVHVVKSDESDLHGNSPSQTPDIGLTFGHSSETLSVQHSTVWEDDGQQQAVLLDLNQHDGHLTNLGVDEDHAAETGTKPSDNQVHKPTDIHGGLHDQSKLVHDAALHDHGTSSLLHQEPGDDSKGPTVDGKPAGATGDNDKDASAHAPPLDHRLIRSLYYEDEEDEEEEPEQVDGEGEEEDDVGPFDSKDRWTHKATETLIDLWAEQRLKAEKPYMKSADWQDILGALNSALDAPPLSVRQVKDKLFYMKKKFKQNRKKRLAGKKSVWPYYERMAAVFEVDKQWSTRAKPDKANSLAKKAKREYKKRQLTIMPAVAGLMGPEHVEHGHADVPGLPGGGGAGGTDGLMASYRNIAIRDFAMSGDRTGGANFAQDRHLPTFNTPPYAAHPMLSTALPNFTGMLPNHPNAHPGVTVLPGLPNLQGMQPMGLPNLGSSLGSLGRLSAPTNTALAALIAAATPVLSFEETFEIEYFISQLQNSPPPGKDPISEADRLKLLDMVEAGHKGVVVAWRVAKEAKAKNPSRDLLLEFWIGVSRQLSARKRTWTEIGGPAMSDQAPPGMAVSAGVSRPSSGF